MDNSIVRDCVTLVLEGLGTEDVDNVMRYIAGLQLSEADLGEDFIIKSALMAASSMYAIRMEETASLDALPSPGHFDKVTNNLSKIIEYVKQRGNE